MTRAAPQKSDSRCAGSNTIAALLAGASEPALERHLDECDSCRRLVADLGRGLSRLGSAPGRALPKIGERLGRFEIARVIGAGGMGVVYEAVDPLLGRTVALKLMRPDLVAAPALLAEAQAMARIQHPNVATVHEVGEVGGQLFVCMEYIAGSTLRAWLQESRALAGILDVFTAAGRGLAHVHAAGLVHFDFKPDNVLIGANHRVVVSDFGLARSRGERGLVIGTPAYMAPEQRRGAHSDARADQYAFCVALREAAGSHAPRWLQRLLARGLAEHAGERFPTMDALLAALEAGRRARPRRVRIAAAVACAAAAVIVIVARGGTSAATLTRVIDRPIVQRVFESSAAAKAPIAAGLEADDRMVASAASGASPSRAVGAIDRIARRDDAAFTPPFVPPAMAYAEASRSALASLAGASPPAPGGSVVPGTAPSAGDCDDGSARTCAVAPPQCPPATLVAVQGGCWTCADEHTCAPLGVPRVCDDSRLTCSTPPPRCPGREVPSIHHGCWSCVDPFTCGSPGGGAPPPQPKPPPRPHPIPTGGTCGNGMCETGEDHDSCPADCCEIGSGGSGGCAATCGNGFCEIGEDHASCPADCCEVGPDGNCLPVCGNGMCEVGEDSTSCAADCH